MDQLKRLLVFGSPTAKAIAMVMLDDEYRLIDKIKKYFEVDKDE